MARNYKVFISHSWTHIDDLKNLRNLLEARGYFNVEFEEATPDEPVNSENAEYIKSRLREKIKGADIVLGIAGIYASHSEWIEWELDFALKKEIPIVGVIPRGKERVSTIVSERAEDVVNWNTESIVTAIKSYAK